jgi:hypothetical protein
MSRRLALLLAILPAAGCGDDGGLDIPPECNPLGGVGCVTPWPSSAYLRDDTTSPTGVRLDLAPGSLPTSADGVELEVAPFNTRTGFTPASQIFTVFPEGVDDSTLVFHDEIERSVEDSSPTVIVDMDTGERVAHFAELDANARDWPEQQALYLRPAARLRGGARYAVGIRDALKAAGGGELTRPPGFQAILDGRGAGHDRLEAMRARTEEAIAALETAGVARDELLVAWDFVTADDESTLADPRAVRDAAVAAIGDQAANLTYQVTTDEPVDADIARRVLFTFESPAVADEGGLFRDGAGVPIVMGTSEARAVAMIPSCATATNRAGIIIFGHGFFGNLEEAQGGYLQRVARDLCMIVVGGEWRGMARDDLAVAATALNDGNTARAFGERILQGIVDFIALEQLARGKLAAEVFLDDADQSIVDPSRTYFYGISQGHILGTTFFAWDPHLPRAALHVQADPRRRVPRADPPRDHAADHADGVRPDRSGPRLGAAPRRRPRRHRRQARPPAHVGRRRLGEQPRQHAAGAHLGRPGARAGAVRPLRARGADRPARRRPRDLDRGAGPAAPRVEHRPRRGQPGSRPPAPP